MAETVVVPDYSLLVLPAQLDVKDACLIEPALPWVAPDGGDPVEQPVEVGATAGARALVKARCYSG